MNKKFLESLANCLENFISNEVEKRCKKLEDERNAAEWNSQRYKRWLLFLIKDNSYLRRPSSKSSAERRLT